MEQVRSEAIPIHSHSAPQSPACTPPKCGDRRKLSACCPNKSRLKRQVSFPEDEFIVSTYFEPPIPWIDSKEICADDIIESYKQSCLKHNVTPIQTLISQIQDIDNFEERSEELDLSGERLEAAQCEALEEVFKRVLFYNLNFESCHLDDEGSMALFDMLEFYEAAIYLNISDNPNISMRGWHSCSRMLKKTPCLQTLNASKTSLNEQCMPIICRALRLGSNIAVLHLENCNITAKTFVILVAALKMNTSISELYLQNNSLTTTDGFQLGNLLRINFRLKIIDLTSNALKDLGVKNGIEGLGDQPTLDDGGLKNFSLKNNHLTSGCMTEVSRSLSKTKSLEKFDLSCNEITNDGILRLKEGLMKNRSLRHLDLRSCSITCEGAVAVAEYIADNSSLQSLDLTDNQIKYGGFMALSLSLKVNSSITSLKLDIPQVIEESENVQDYEQMLNDISNFCIRNQQTARENDIMTEEEACDKMTNCDISGNTLTEKLNLVNNNHKVTVNNSPSVSTSSMNGRFHVSKVSNIPKYVSSNVNGRFKVFKVESVSEKANKCIEQNDKNSDDSCLSVEIVKGEVNDKKIAQNTTLTINNNESGDKKGVDSRDDDHAPSLIDISNQKTLIESCSFSSVKKLVNNVKQRRKSTPAIGTNLSRMIRSRRPSLNLSLNKQLECLDLRSTVPLSPGRFVESCGLPMSSVDAMIQMDDTIRVVFPTGTGIDL